MSELKDLLREVVQDSFNFGALTAKNPKADLSGMNSGIQNVVKQILKEYDKSE